MKRKYCILFVIFITSYILIIFLNKIMYIDITDIYTKNLRSYFFMAFITIGGFLLSLKTFIIITIKKELYDSNEYKKLFDGHKLLNDKLTLYGPLVRLGKFLINCVIIAITTSVIQITIGFIPNLYASTFCISLAFTTLAMVFIAWWEIKQNLIRWFDVLDNNQ